MTAAIVKQIFDECAAKSRLRRASEELLAACEAFIEWDDSAHDHNVNSYGRWVMYCEALRMAREAVAKARTND